MKKAIAFVVMAIAIITMITTIHHYTYDNVFFETSKKYETMSLEKGEMASDEIINDDVVVRVKVDYGGNLLEAIRGIQNQYLSTITDDSTEEEIKEARRGMRQAMREFHLSMNYQRLEKFNLANYESVYVSTYSPYIEYTYSTTEFVKNRNAILSSISSNRGVESIHVADNYVEYDEQLSDAVEKAGMGDVFLRRTYTGTGVVVGVLEPGIIDKNFAGLAGTNYKIKKQLFQDNTVAEHTTLMATCIAGRNGIAPQAKILSISLNGSPVNEIDWMVDNDVDIINMSFCEGTPTGVYSSVSAYVDYIAYTEKVIMVAAAGNNRENGGPGYIGNPALAVNAISVGSTVYTNTAVAPFSSNVVADQSSAKPTLCVVGHVVTIPDANGRIMNGTSVSAAIVSGICALLLEETPHFRMYPARLRAYLVAHCKRLGSYEFTPSRPLNEYLGAGTLDLLFRNNHRKVHFTETYCKASDTAEYFFDFPVTINEGETLRFAVCWDAIATGNLGETVYGDYDLKLFRETTLVETSNAMKSNVEVLEWKAPSSKMYHLRIKRYGDIINNSSLSNVDELSYCFWIDSAES